MTSCCTPSCKLTSWLGSILAGGISAALFAVCLTSQSFWLVFLVYLATLPLFYSGFSSGFVKACVAALIACVGVFAMTENAQAAVAYALIYALPTLLLIGLALRYRTNEQGQVFWYPEGPLLVATTLCPCVLFLLASVYAYATGEEGGLLGVSLRSLHNVLTNLTQSAMQEGLSPEDAEALTTNMQSFVPVAERMAQTLPSLLGFAWILVALVNGVVAQIALQTRKRAIRAPFNLTNVEVPLGFVILTACVGVISFFLPQPLAYIGFNLLVMLFFPLLVVGLAVVHAFAKTTTMPRLFLGGFYTVFAIVPWLAPIIAVLGAVDLKFHFRQRFAQLPKPISKV